MQCHIKPFQPDGEVCKIQNKFQSVLQNKILKIYLKFKKIWYQYHCPDTFCISATNPDHALCLAFPNMWPTLACCLPIHQARGTERQFKTKLAEKKHFTCESRTEDRYSVRASCCCAAKVFLSGIGNVGEHVCHTRKKHTDRLGS